MFRQDLRQFGYPTDALGRIVGNYTNVIFLSNDLVLVTVNTKTYGDEEPGADEFPSDQPNSRLLLFDVSQRRLVKEVELPVRKASESVASIGNEQFVLLSHAGLHVCSRDLECATPIETHGPLFVSPNGSMVVAGGRGQSEQTLFQTRPLKALAHFPVIAPKVIPGDNCLLVLAAGKLYVGSAQNPEERFLLDAESSGIWPDARFLNADTVAAIQGDQYLALLKTDGSVLRRIDLLKRVSLAEVSAAGNGSRFCLHQVGYTALRSAFAALHLEQTFNFERVNVMDVGSGKSFFKMTWDPQPYVGNLSRPALSPDGHRLAIIRNGQLDVFSIK